MRLGRRRDAVDRLGGDLHRGVEAERDVGRGDVVVDRLRDADERHALAQRAAAPCGAFRRRRPRRARRSPRAPASAAATRRLPRGRRGRAATCRGSCRHAAGSRARRRGRAAAGRPPSARPSRRGSRRTSSAVVADRSRDDAADHGVETGAVAARGEDPSRFTRIGCCVRDSPAIVVLGHQLSTGTSACRRRGAPSAGSPRCRRARRRRRA